MRKSGDPWEEFGFHLGPFGFSMGSFWGNVRHTMTDDSHLLRIRIAPEIKKEEIKARLVKPGILEVQWPRRLEGEDIPVE